MKRFYVAMLALISSSSAFAGEFTVNITATAEQDDNGKDMYICTQGIPANATGVRVVFMFDQKVNWDTGKFHSGFGTFSQGSLGLGGVVGTAALASAGSMTFKLVALDGSNWIAPTKDNYQGGEYKLGTQLTGSSKPTQCSGGGGWHAYQLLQ